MKLGKWIGGIMGFMTMGPLGALAGYAIGSLFDKANDAQAEFEGGGQDTACHGFLYHPCRWKNHA